MTARGDFVSNEMGRAIPDADIHKSVITGGHGKRILLGWIHSPQIFTFSCRRIKSDQFGRRVRPAVELSIRGKSEAPDILFGVTGPSQVGHAPCAWVQSKKV